MDIENVLVAYIGDQDPHIWLQGEGKAVLMPVLLKTAEEVIYNNLDEKQAARIEAQIRGKMRALDFWVRFDGVEDTLEKIMEWALNDEEYEICGDVKYLQEYVKDLKQTLQKKDEDFSYRG